MSTAEHREIGSLFWPSAAPLTLNAAHGGGSARGAGGCRRGLAARGRVRSSYVTAKAEMHGGLMLGSDDDGVDDELDDDDDDADSCSFDYAAHDY